MPFSKPRFTWILFNGMYLFVSIPNIHVNIFSSSTNPQLYLTRKLSYKSANMLFSSSLDTIFPHFCECIPPEQNVSHQNRELSPSVTRYNLGNHPRSAKFACHVNFAQHLGGQKDPPRRPSGCRCRV